jgi:aspartate/methionine/tyrosine aminotransferase
MCIAFLISHAFDIFCLVSGAMYIFPRVRLPAAAVAEAKKQNLAPDLFYAIQLLDNTGVVVVPVYYFPPFSLV